MLKGKTSFEVIWYLCNQRKGQKTLPPISPCVRPVSQWRLKQDISHFTAAHPSQLMARKIWMSLKGNGAVIQIFSFAANAITASAGWHEGSLAYYFLISTMAKREHYHKGSIWWICPARAVYVGDLIWVPSPKPQSFPALTEHWIRFSSAGAQFMYGDPFQVSHLQSRYTRHSWLPLAFQKRACKVHLRLSAWFKKDLYLIVHIDRYGGPTHTKGKNTSLGHAQTNPDNRDSKK